MPNANDASVKLSVDGLGEFKRDLQAAQNSVRLLGSETKLAESEFRKTGDAQVYMQQKTDALTKQIDAQQKAVETCEKGLKKASEAYGENSKQALTWQSNLNKARTALNNLESDLRDVSDGTDKLLKSTKNASQATSELGRTANGITFNVYGNSIDAITGKLENLGSTASRIGKNLKGGLLGDLKSIIPGLDDFADNLAQKIFGVSASDLKSGADLAKRGLGIGKGLLGAVKNATLGTSAKALLSTLGVGAAGFTGGIASVLGVGLLAKALAGESTFADFGTFTGRARSQTRNFKEPEQEYLKKEAENQKALVDRVVDAIEKLQENPDWRAEDAEKFASMTADDIRRAMESVSLTVRSEDGETPKSQIEVDIQLTADAVAVALNDKKIAKTEIEGIQKYVKENFEPAVEAAVGLISGGWSTVLTAMDHPTPGASATPQGEEEKTPYTSMTDWVTGNVEADYKTAKEKAEGLWSDLLGAVTEPGPGGTTADGESAALVGSTYLTGKVAELVKVKEEIDTIVAALAEAVAQGIPVDPASLDRLDTLMNRAEKIGAEVGWYESEEAVRGRGALGLAMSGENWTPQVAADAMAYLRSLREHELAGIQGDVDLAKNAEGNAYLNYLASQGALGDLLNKYGTDERQWGTEAQAAIVAAEDQLTAAKAAYEAAKAEADQAAAEAVARKVSVENEFNDSMTEVFAGMAQLLGYSGTGPATYAPVTTTGSPVPIWELSGYAMGTAGHGWANPFGNTEAGRNLNAQQVQMTAREKQIADMLFATFGSFESFMSSLPADQMVTMYGLANGTPGVGTANEQAVWSNILYRAFGLTPGGGFDANSAVLNGAPVDVGASSIKFVEDLLGLVYRETDTEAKAAAARQSAAEKNALLRQYTDTYNEASGYNAYREQVRSWAEAGAFQGMDWSLGDYGLLESAVADLAAEAEAKGEEVGDMLGTGMERSFSENFTFGELAGKDVADGLTQGITEGTPAAVGAATAMATAVNDAVRSALDINSPSRVMAGLGRYVTEGFAQGIGSAVDEVQSAAWILARSVTSPLASAARSGGSRTYNSSSALYIDKYYQNSSDDIDYLSSQMATRQQQQLQGFGHGR